jgi:hypothetical protein
LARWQVPTGTSLSTMFLGGSLRHRYLLPAVVLESACALVGAATSVRAAPQTAASQISAEQISARAGADPGPALWLPGGPTVEVSSGMVLSRGGTLQDTLVSLAIGSSSY